MDGVDGPEGREAYVAIAESSVRLDIKAALRADREGFSAAARRQSWASSRRDKPSEFLEQQLMRLEEQDARRRGELIDSRIAEAIEPIIARQEVAEEHHRQYERRLGGLERLVGRLTAWLDQYRSRIEGLFAQARGRAGRPAELQKALLEQMREDGVTQDQVRPGTYARFARVYGVERRTIKRARDDL